VQKDSGKEWDQIWVGANIATMVAGKGPYGNIKEAALAVKGERIAWIGPAGEGYARALGQGIPVQDAQGLWITPGLIDCHTHLVYGGNRVEEFEKRLCGVSYEEIARAGGGIQSTVQATRAQTLGVETTVFQAVAQAYLDVVRDQTLVEVSRNNEQVLRKQLEATRDRFRVGEVTRTDVAQAESSLAQATAQRINAEGQLENSPESLLLRIASRGLELGEIEREWDAQVSKIQSAGISPTHLDGHKHVQMLPGLFEIALRLAKKYGIRAIRVSHEASKLRTVLSTGGDQKTGVVLKQGVQARGLKLLARDAREMADHAGLVTTDYFCGIAQTGALTREGVELLLQNLPEGTTELMCHPGYADEDLRRTATRLQESRQTELEILTDARTRKIVAMQGIRLISYQFMGEVA